MLRAVFFALIAVAAVPLPAFAQSFSTRWGLQASFTPSWSVPDAAKDLFSAESMKVEGRELRIGFVRGRTLGGDWGISFVQKSLSDGAFADTGDVIRTSERVVVRGAAIDRFVNFGTIKERVQIGMILGIGAGAASGTATERDKRTGVETQIEAKHFFTPFDQEIPVVPLARLELAIAAIIAPGLKIRASGGLNYPGVAMVTVGGVYLFGER